MRLSVVPDRISECEAEVSVDVEDLCAVEGGGWVAVDGDGYALFAGEFKRITAISAVWIRYSAKFPPLPVITKSRPPESSSSSCA